MGGRTANRLSLAALIAGAGIWAAAPDILGLPDAIALWVGVGSAMALQGGNIVRSRRRKRQNLLSTSTGIYRLAKDFEPIGALRLHRSAVAVRAAASPVGDGLPPYVSGVVDDQADRALARNPFLLIVGNALSGKSRVAFEAIRRNFPTAEIWVPSGPAGLRKLLEQDPPLSLGWRPVVVWLDGLDYYLEPLRQGGSSDQRTVTAALMARHLARRRRWRRTPSLLFVATMSRREHDALSDRVFLHANHSEREVAEIAALAEPVKLDDGPAAGWDAAEAVCLYPGLDFSDGIGRTFAEAETILHAYRNGADEVGRGIARAAVDWWRIGAGWPSRDRLRGLLAVVLPGAIIDENDFHRGLRWANREIVDGQRLLAERTGDEDEEASFVAHPLLLDADEGYGPGAEGRRVAEGVWDIALRELDARDLLAVAEQAGERDEAVAERILLRLVDSDGAPGSHALTRAVAQLELGLLYQTAGNRDAEARERFVAAIRAGDATIRVFAHLKLAWMHEREADTDEEFTTALAVEGAEPWVTAMALYERGSWRHSKGWGEEAEADLSAAIAHEATDPHLRAWALLKRAFIYEDRGWLAEQRADLDTAIDLHVDPELGALAYCVRGISQSDPERALGDFDAALDCNCSVSQQGSAHCLRGETLAELERFEEAEAAYLTAIELSDAPPDDVASWRLDRAVTLEGRNPARDRADFEWAIETAGVLPRTIGRAHLLRAKAGYDELQGEEWGRDLVEWVAADLGKAIELGDAELRAEGHYLRGQLLTNGHGTLRTALEDFTVAIGIEDATPHTIASSYIHRALIHCHEGRYDEAEVDFEAGISTPGATPRSVAVGLVDRGLMRLERGHRDLAEKDFRAAVWIKEGQEPTAGALRYLGEILRSSGRLEEERALFREAAESGRPELVAVALPHLEAEARRQARRVGRRGR